MEYLDPIYAEVNSAFRTEIFEAECEIKKKVFYMKENLSGCS